MKGARIVLSLPQEVKGARIALSLPFPLRVKGARIVLSLSVEVLGVKGARIVLSLLKQNQHLLVLAGLCLHTTKAS